MGRAIFLALRRLVLVLVAFELGYVVLVNAALTLGIVELAFAGSESVKMHHGRAYTWLPGRVHVENVLVTMQDHNLQWDLRLDWAEVDIRLDELARRTVHLTRVRGGGATFRHRQRVSPEALEQAATLALPPIDGQEDPPVQNAWVAGKPVGEFEYALWTVHIEDVDVGVRELWSQQFRYQGEGRVRGAFRLRPAKHLWVGPALLELERGTLSAGDGVLLSDVRARVDCTVLPFHVSMPVGAEVLGFITARVRMTAQVASLAPLCLFLSPDIKLEDGSGQLDMDLAMTEGTLRRESFLRYETDRARVEASGVGASIGGDLSLGGGMARKGEEGVLAVAIRTTLLERMGNRHAPVRVERARLELSTTTVDATMPWTLGRVSVHLGEALAPNLRALNDPSGKGFQVREGSARLAGFLELDGALAGTGAFSAQASLDGASEGGLLVSGRVSAELEAQALRLREKSGRLSGHILAPAFAASRPGAFGFELDDARASAAGAVSEGGRLSGATLDASIERLGASGGQASASARRARVALRGTDLGIPGGDGRVSGRISLSDLAGTGGSAGSVWVARAQAFSLAADGSVARGRELSGAVAAKLEKGHLSSRSMDVRAGVEADVRLSSVDLVEHTGRVVAQAETGRVSVSFGGGSAASSGGFESAKLFASVDVPRGLTEGTGEVQAALRGARFRQSGSAVSGELALRARLANVSIDRGEAVAWGAAQLSQVAGSWSGASVDGWWGRVDLDGARVRGGDEPELHSALRASFRDGLPFLKALAGAQDIPAWLPEVLHLNGLHASGSVRQERGVLVVDVPEAGGGPLQAAGRLVSGPSGEPRAAVLVESGPLSLGISLRGKETSLFPLAGQEWLKERLVELDAASSASRAPCPLRAERSPGGVCGARRP